MRASLRKIGIVLIILAILGIGSVIAWRYAMSRGAMILRKERESFESEVNQTLPIGSDKVRVQQFLNSKRMTFIDTGPISQEGDTFSTIEAISKDEIAIPLGACWPSAQFRFDSHGKLLGYTDRSSCKWIF
jgi:hypothetical protein